MTESPLVAPVVFQLGPVPITLPVLGTCGVAAALGLPPTSLLDVVPAQAPARRRRAGPRQPEQDRQNYFE